MTDQNATIATSETMPRVGLIAGQPRGLSTLFYTELWERFSYYGMRALLTLFMVAPIAEGGMALGVEDASRIYGNYTMAVYMLAIPGGFIADRILGARTAVMLGGWIIALGHYALAVPAEASFYIGLFLVAIGTGLFKPNISGLVGALYAKNDDRRDAGFSLFYMGINIGAFVAPFITGFLAQHQAFKDWLASMGFDPAQSWHWGFGAAGVGMTLAMLIFARRSKDLAEPVTHEDRLLGARNVWRDGFLVALGTLGLLGLALASDLEGFEWLRWLFIVVPIGLIIYFGLFGNADGKRIAAIGVLFVAAMIFFAIFEQMGTSMSLFADRLTENTLFGSPFPSSWYQAVNPLFVILLAPVFAWAWIRLGARQPSAAVKFALGLLFVSLSFFWMIPAAQLAAAGKVSPVWIIGLFLLQTIGELLLSPVGLSTMTKLAPERMTGLVLGLWFLAAAFGNKLAGVLGGTFESENAEGLASFFLTQAAWVLVAAGLLFFLAPWVRRLAGDAR